MSYLLEYSVNTYRQTLIQFIKNESNWYVYSTKITFVNNSQYMSRFLACSYNYSLAETKKLCTALQSLLTLQLH